MLGRAWKATALRVTWSIRPRAMLTSLWCACSCSMQAYRLSIMLKLSFPAAFDHNQGSLLLLQHLRAGRWHCRQGAHRQPCWQSGPVHGLLLENSSSVTPIEKLSSKGWTGCPQVISAKLPKTWALCRPDTCLCSICCGMDSRQPGYCWVSARLQQEAGNLHAACAPLPRLTTPAQQRQQKARPRPSSV